MTMVTRARNHAVTALLGAMFMVSGGCGRNPAPHPRPVQRPQANASILRIGNGAEIDSLDPARAALGESGAILRDVYEGLACLGYALEPIPCSAERWEMSQDGRTFTFHLRRDARWSNGEAVTADDFVRSWRRLVDPKTASPFAKTLASVQNAPAIIAGVKPAESLGAAAVDASTLVVRLAQPLTYFPALTAQWCLFPTYRGAAPLPAGRTISNGAFVLTESLPNSRTVLARNRRYWNNSANGLDEVRYYQIDEPAQEVSRFRAGELDVTSNVPAAADDQLRAAFGSRLMVSPILGLYYFGFNVRKEPFTSRALRDALSMSIDRDRVVSLAPIGARAAYTWVPDGFPNYTPQKPYWAAWPYDRRISRARELYAEAGYSARRPLRFVLHYNAGSGHERIALALAAMWKAALGAEAQPAAEEMRALIQRAHVGDVEIFRSSWVADYPDPYAFLEVMQSGAGLNLTRFSSNSFDRLLTEAQSEPDGNKRRVGLQRAERVLADEAVAVPLYAMARRRLVAPRVHGWTENALSVYYSKNVNLVE